MKNFLSLLITALLFTTCVSTQEIANGDDNDDTVQQLVYDDFIYDKNIKTVQFYRGQFENAYPVKYKGDPVPLTIEFDELLPEESIESDLWADFIACDHNWKPTNELPIAFYEGYSQQRIPYFMRSQNTKVPYVHYQYSFPQEESFFKIAGNYILKIYRNDSKREAVLTRRFVVAEKQQVFIAPTGILNARIERLNLKELRFTVTPSASLNIINPANDLEVKVLQNWRWDNALTGLAPRFIGNGKFEYLINLEEQFQSGNEFRLHDNRSTRFFSQSVKQIEEYDDYYSVTLFEDKPRLKNEHGSRLDLNGSYVIDVQEWQNPDYEADYVINHFRLDYSPAIENARVFVFGELSMWQPQPDFKMDFNEASQRYEGEILLKQGIYDYQYVVMDNTTGKLDELRIEGMNVDLEDYYTVLVYYRAPIDRAHRLVGYQTMNYYDE